jgi:hypothetical protein
LTVAYIHVHPSSFTVILFLFYLIRRYNIRNLYGDVKERNKEPARNKKIAELYPQGKSPWYPSDRRLDGPQT